MGAEFKREKKKVWLVSFINALQRLIPLSKEKKFRFFLRMEWIFDRLAHEKSFQYLRPEQHPFRKYSFRFMDENIPENSTILDFGSNYGVISCHLSNRAKRVVGIDHDPDAINSAKLNYNAENLEFIQTDAFEYLNKNEKEFDVLILSHILEHLDNREEFLNRYKRFFKFIYIELPDFDKNYLNHYRKEIGDELIYTDNDHVVEFDRDELLTLLEKCNIKVRVSEYRFGLIKLWCETGS